MERDTQGRPQELVALLIAPDRELARKFTATLPHTRAFQIMADLKSWPTRQALEIRLRQLRPEVVLLDVASDLDAACEVIRWIVSFSESVQIVGLHHSNESEAILRSLRTGASEFLHAPFDPASQQEAIARLRRLRQPETSEPVRAGNVLVFSSAKPGSGASTLATQTAFALMQNTGKRILLADFDVMGGTIGFYLKLAHTHSLVDALSVADRIDPVLWSGLVVNSGGIDILPAPEMPGTDLIEPDRLHTVIEFARLTYDWVVIDLPVVFQRISLMTISEADQAFLVTTSELPSLHLARKAVAMLQQLGFPRERFQIAVNRMDKRNGVTVADMEKLFNCHIHSRFPNDVMALHRAVTLAEPLGAECELGRAVESLAGRLAAIPVDRLKAEPADARTVLSLR
jgi:pilus assembly protein CpaE